MYDTCVGRSPMYDIITHHKNHIICYENPKFSGVMIKVRTRDNPLDCMTPLCTTFPHIFPPIDCNTTRGNFRDIFRYKMIYISKFSRTTKISLSGTKKPKFFHPIYTQNNNIKKPHFRGVFCYCHTIFSIFVMVSLFHIHPDATSHG